MATAWWTFILMKVPWGTPRHSSRQALGGPLQTPLFTTYQQVCVGNLARNGNLDLGMHQRGDCSQIPPLPRELSTAIRDVEAGQQPLSLSGYCTRKTPTRHPSLIGVDDSADQTHCPGRITAYCAHSPRRTSTLTGRFLSSLPSMASNCLTSATCAFASAKMTSPVRRPARAAGPCAASTNTPPLMLSSRFCAALKSDNCKPSDVAASLVSAAFSALDLGASISPTTTVRAL